MPKLNIREAEVMDMYIARLIADKGLTAENRASNERIFYELKQQFEEACERAMVEALPDDKAIELSQKLDDTNFTDAQIEEFFEQTLPNAEEIMLNTMAKFRAEYLGDAAAPAVSDTQVVSEQPAVEAVAVEITETDTSNDVTSGQNNATEPPVGNPVQGTASSVPGVSDVEGVAQTAAAVNSAAQVPVVEQTTTVTEEEM